MPANRRLKRGLKSAKKKADRKAQKGAEKVQQEVGHRFEKLTTTVNPLHILAKSMLRLRPFVLKTAAKRETAA